MFTLDDCIKELEMALKGNTNVLMTRELATDIKINLELCKALMEIEKHTPKLRIDCFGNRTEVYENGIQHKGVTSIEFETSIDEIPELTIKKFIGG